MPKRTRKGKVVKYRKRKSMRKYRRYKIYRMKPEVKYIIDYRDFSFPQKINSASQFTSAALFTYPSQGLTDTNRIGDTIRPVLLQFRYAIQAEVTQLAPIYCRVVIFTAGTNNTNWCIQASSTKPAINGTTDFEIVRKVYYDKTHLIQPAVYNSTTSRQIGGGTKVFVKNIKLRKPITFSNGSQGPKDDADRFYICTIGYNRFASHDANLANLSGTARFYFSDS